mmetsp:Transcript_6016/g.9561  ORF Transcript_6016/g.9561 Transcript_6016/m.9561 type:complete len:356 (+) Transcript_6016:831-1898(+)
MLREFLQDIGFLTQRYPEGCDANSVADNWGPVFHKAIGEEPWRFLPASSWVASPIVRAVLVFPPHGFCFSRGKTPSLRIQHAQPTDRVCRQQVCWTEQVTFHIHVNGSLVASFASQEVSATSVSVTLPKLQEGSHVVDLHLQSSNPADGGTPHHSIRFSVSEGPNCLSDQQALIDPVAESDLLSDQLCALNGEVHDPRNSEFMRAALRRIHMLQHPSVCDSSTMIVVKVTDQLVAQSLGQRRLAQGPEELLARFLALAQNMKRALVLWDGKGGDRFLVWGSSLVTGNCSALDVHGVLDFTALCGQHGECPKDIEEALDFVPQDLEIPCGQGGQELNRQEVWHSALRSYISDFQAL